MADISCGKCKKFLTTGLKINEGRESAQEFIERVPTFQAFKFRYFKHAGTAYRYESIESRVPNGVLKLREDPSDVFVKGVSVTD
jgi:hypothetical protein